MASSNTSDKAKTKRKLFALKSSRSQSVPAKDANSVKSKGKFLEITCFFCLKLIITHYLITILSFTCLILKRILISQFVFYAPSPPKNFAILCEIAEKNNILLPSLV